ncbi:MAG: hypothetical protein L0Y43_08395 [Methylococcaceae bacterium]|nr:hypothetical protein [Methylococcaceae bacterium]
MQMKKLAWSIAPISALMMGQPPEAHAGGKKAVISRAMSRILARDAARDAARMAKAKALQQSTQMWRYTSRAQSEFSLKHGLPTRPEVRMTVQLPRGQQLIRNKVIVGAPGQGEIVIKDTLPAGAIRNIKPLP